MGVHGGIAQLCYESASSARVAASEPQVPDHAPLCRSTVQRRPRSHWLDGPGTRSLCPSILVVAHTPQHSRKTEDIRADSLRFSHPYPYTQREQRGVQVAAFLW